LALIVGGMLLGSERYVVYNTSPCDIFVVYKTYDGMNDSVCIEATKWKLIGKRMVWYKKYDKKNKCSVNQYFTEVKIYVGNKTGFINALDSNWICASQPRLNEFTLTIK